MKMVRRAATAALAICGLAASVAREHGNILMAQTAPTQGKAEREKEAWGEPVGGLAISISTEKPAYRPGEPIALKVRLKNVGRTDVRAFEDRYSFTGPYSVTVSLPDGKKAPQTMYAKRMFELEAARWEGSGVTKKLRPGEELVSSEGLSRWFDVTLAGKYTVTAGRVLLYRRKNANGEQPPPVEAVSNKIEFAIDESVLGREEQERAAEKERAERDMALLRHYLLGIPRHDWPAYLAADEEVRATVAAYDKAVADLLRAAARSAGSDARIYIFYLLGELRAEAAVPTLVTAIDFEPVDADYSESVRSRQARLGPYPAQEALVKIGSPAVGPIVAALGKEDGATRRELMVGVLREVLGRGVAEFALQKALESAPPAEKARYEQAKALLKAGEPKAPDKK